MPPKSRKRNKGKERKVKKEDKAEIERKKANKFWQLWKHNNRVGCKHGNDTVIADNHPVSKFLDEFFIQWQRLKHFMTILEDMLQTHRQVWTDENYRELAIQTCISIGTNFLLMESNTPINDIHDSLCMAKAILALEMDFFSAWRG